MDPAVGARLRKYMPLFALGLGLTFLAVVAVFILQPYRLPARLLNQPAFRVSHDSDGTTSLLVRTARMLNAVDGWIADIMYRVRGPGDYPSTADDLAVVVIDEESIFRLGAWPWPRDLLADLLDKLRGASVVGLDLVFMDQDKTSLVYSITRLESKFDTRIDVSSATAMDLDNDLRLARSIAKDRTVLGTLLVDGKGQLLPVRQPIAPYTILSFYQNGTEIDNNAVLLRTVSGMYTNVAPLRETEPPPVGEGFINLFPELGGTVRSVPLFAHINRAPTEMRDPGGNLDIMPSLPLEVIRVALGGDTYRITVREDTVLVDPVSGRVEPPKPYHPIRSISIIKQLEWLGDPVELIRIPVNQLGEIDVGLRGYFHDYNIYPAWEVLEGRHDDAFAGKMVLVGSSVRGIEAGAGIAESDQPLVQAHASVLSAILKGDFMDDGYRGDFPWQVAAILCSGLAVTFGTAVGGAASGLFLGLLWVAMITAGNYFLFFRRGMQAGIAMPLLTLFVVLVAELIASYLLVGRERRFIRKAFQLNVSPSILGYLESNPDKLSSLQGEHRYMSVLFTDIRGFTSFSEKMTAPDLARFLNEYFTPMSDMVMENMGTVDKFIGDGLMAFWNAPADNPNHANDAAQTALDMVEQLSQLQEGWTARGLPKVAIGCGINTGAMFAGYMGSEQRKNYTVMGDNVNIASRLESLSKVYSASILITEATRDELAGDFKCRIVDKVRLSGKAEAVTIYELLGRGESAEEEMEEFAAFARVFELYQLREFATAESLLKELVFIRPNPLYKMYLDRLAIYKALPPPDDWDGTFVMTQK